MWIPKGAVRIRRLRLECGIIKNFVWRHTAIDLEENKAMSQSEFYKRIDNSLKLSLS